MEIISRRALCLNTGRENVEELDTQMMPMRETGDSLMLSDLLEAESLFQPVKNAFHLLDLCLLRSKDTIT